MNRRLWYKMKKLLSIILLLSIMMTSFIAITSCDASNDDEDYIDDDQREAHILELIGDYEIIGQCVKTETIEVDDSGKEIIKTESEWVVHEDYEDQTIGKASTVNGLRRGLEDYTLMMENDNYALYMVVEYEDTYPNMSAIAVEDKTTGYVYHSNPTATTGTFSNIALSTSDGAVEYPIVSPVAIEAYDIANKRYEFNYYQHCSSAMRLYILKTGENSLRVIYTIGNDPDADLAPPVLTVDTYNWIKGKLEAMGDEGKTHLSTLRNQYKESDPDDLELEDRERFIDDYPTIEMYPMYIARTMNVRQKQLVKACMEAVGFTAEMLKAEMDAVEYSGPARSVMYTIPVDLTLTEEGLNVTIDSSLILAPQKQKLYKIYLYRALGSMKPQTAGSRANGATGLFINNDSYMIIPDGSGAIMPAAGNLTTDVFSGRVYGLDDTFQVTYDVSPEEQVVTPFLAYDRSNLGGMVAILADGGAQAFATARPANNTNNPGASINYDLVYAERSYLTYSGGQGASDAAMVDMDNSSSGAVLSKEENVAVYSVDYLFTPGDYTVADYANLYRNYLIEHEIMPSEVKSDSTVPFYVDLLGAINKDEVVFGVPTDSVKALTTYAEVKEIADALLEGGVENINMRYLYWCNDGFYNTLSENLQFVSAMGTPEEFRQLSAYLAGEDIGFYPDVNFITIAKDNLFDGLSYSMDAARSLDMTIARVYDRDLASGIADTPSLFSDNASSYTHTVISADMIPDLAKGFKADIDGYLTNKQISLGAIGSVIDSNYKVGRIVNRTQSLDNHILALEEFSDYEIMVEKGNDYTWKYASHILNLPVGSSQYMSTTEAIPFLQMVLHGYIDYAASPLNEDGDYSTAILEMLETGSGVYFKWMGEENSILDLTTFSYKWYSVNYKNSLDKALEIYDEVSGLMNKVANKPITNYEVLEAYHVFEGERTYYAEGDEQYVEGELNASYNRIPVENVYATTYGGSVKFIVNYNDYDVELADEKTVIPAMGYLEVNVK